MLFTDVSSERAIKAFIKAGFWMAKGHSSKHTGLINGKRKITIPNHPRLNPYTLKAIIRDAGLTAEEFRGLLWGRGT